MLNLDNNFAGSLKYLTLLKESLLKELQTNENPK